MSTLFPTSHARRVYPSQIPPLQQGDHLTREEFERRFDATPDLKKAELINGVVYMPPPVSIEWHSEPHAALAGVIAIYKASTPGVRGGLDGSVRFDDVKSMPQPDAFLFLDPRVGGQARVGADKYLEGSPELIVEIAASTVSFDLHEKCDLYEHSGVREYIVWRTHDGEMDHFQLSGGKFILKPQGAHGILRSDVFPGFWIDVKSLVADDLKQAIALAQQGVNSPEHAAFVVDLQLRADRLKSDGE